MTITRIGEKIDVAAFFGVRDKFRPLWFMWDKRKISIEQVLYRWQERDGMNRAHHFSVTDGASTYHLCYDSGRLAWQLVAVETEV